MPAGQGQQGATQRLGHHQLLACSQPDGGDPAQQVVVLTGAITRAVAGTEVAGQDPGVGAELPLWVGAMVGVQFDRGADPVGDEGVVAPVGEQLGLGALEAGAAHDQPVTR